MKFFNNVFKKPTRADIRWSEFVKALKEVGYFLDKKKGVQCSFKHDTIKEKLFIHEPHGSNNIPKSDIDRIRDKLKEVGII